MKIAAGIVAVSILAGCATEKGNQRHSQHASDQVRMIAVQREAMVQEAEAESQTQQALVEALTEVAKANPDHAPAVTVALAVIGVRGSSEGNDVPIVSLQQQRNEALEWTKALAPTVGGLITGLGVAAINADVTKNAQDANKDIQINDAQSDVSIVQAVAGLGTAAASSVGIQAGGDVYQVSDSGSIDQSVNTADSNNTTSTSTFSLATTLNYDGTSMTLADLITQLQSAGASYSIDLDGDGTPDVEGEGDGGSSVIYCDGFSPAIPNCVEI